MAKTEAPLVIAWGQYVHWADLQFSRYISMSREITEADQIGTVSHWLASEYIVLDGWKQLNDKDIKIDKLIALYPEHCESLRRCRNAVSHFQREPLDEGIGKCLENKNEELSWSK